jgi:hypothetical protein
MMMEGITLAHLKISETRDYFLKDGKPFFYLADTAWTAFFNPSMEEWEEYLEYRKAQGFNVIQINILTQWDGGAPDTGLYPFKIDAEGKFDFYSMNEEYFKHAQKLLDLACKRGFIPALIVLWGNYVKGTWMTDINPANIMPMDVVKSYTEYVVKMFAPYNPIYMAAGDTNFGSEDATRYYLTVMETIKSLSPDSLVTLHIGGGFDVQPNLPEFIINSPHYDFYLYQSGHERASQDNCYKMAKAFYEKPAKRPVINGEPCYEGHYFGGKYGRYNAFDIRKAIWQSLLSGAKAGVTYGAHGMWLWYREGKEFGNIGYGGKPVFWQVALRYEGAWDAGFSKYIFETYNLFDLEPKDAILNETEEIRMSVSKDSSKVAIYVPYNTDVKVNMDLSGYEWSLINLSEKLFAKPVVQVENGCSVIKMHNFNSDILLIGTRRREI